MAGTTHLHLPATSTLIPAAYSRLIAGWHHQFLATMLDWAEAIERKDPYTAGHARRVTSYSLLLGMELNLCEEELADLWLAAALHDVGKIFVSDAILDKPGPLTPEEAAAMKIHPVAGARILAQVRSMHGAVEGVRHHHERYDGRGYPDGLQGDEIPLQARIIAVADTYDAITSRRPYRDALSPQHAAREIVAGEGTQLCPSVALAFRSLFDDGRFTV
jgi:HD-GYP domain-containing protein (c-di-GMP phosphodiesterase class II)